MVWFKMKSWFKIIKHSLGSFTELEGYDIKHENQIAIIRMFIVGSNLLCVWIIIVNVTLGWL